MGESLAWYVFDGEVVQGQQKTPSDQTRVTQFKFLYVLQRYMIGDYGKRLMMDVHIVSLQRLNDCSKF